MPRFLPAYGLAAQAAYGLGFIHDRTRGIQRTRPKRHHGAPWLCALYGGLRIVPADRMKNVKFVVGIDDRVYMRWQLSILLESLHGKLPPGWEVWVVVCNGHEELSADLRRVLATYGARHFTGVNHPRDQNMDFAAGRDVYVPLNRIEALRVVAEHSAPTTRR